MELSDFVRFRLLFEDEKKGEIIFKTKKEAVKYCKDNGYGLGTCYIYKIMCKFKPVGMKIEVTKCTDMYDALGKRVE